MSSQPAEHRRWISSRLVLVPVLAMAACLVPESDAQEQGPGRSVTDDVKVIRDPLASLDQSELLRDALQSQDVPETLYLVEGGGHGRGFPPEIDRMVHEFFDRTLKADADSITKDSDRR